MNDLASSRSAAAETLPAPRRGPPDALGTSELDPCIDAALAEDLGPGDLTSRACIPAEVPARGALLAKAPGRLAGATVFARVFQRVDPAVAVEHALRDGDELVPGAVVARVRGRARSLLAAERTALNFVQRMSGIATVTARCVAIARGRVRVLDTRKTTPCLRALEKYAVRCGGGENHRFGLHDEVLIKNNHVDLAGRGLEALAADARRAVGPRVRVGAEARDEGEALAAVRGGADLVLLDNLPPGPLAALVRRLRREAAGRERPLEIEASGGIGLDDLDAYAATGVDRVSLGMLTHSAPALDLSFSIEAGA